jgi:hypothetical protein
MKNFNLWFFHKKLWWAEKGEFHFFQKMPCPQYKFCVKHKKLPFFAKQAGR